jgi:hypothetical protein
VRHTQDRRDPCHPAGNRSEGKTTSRSCPTHSAQPPRPPAPAASQAAAKNGRVNKGGAHLECLRPALPSGNLLGELLVKAFKSLLPASERSGFVLERLNRLDSDAVSSASQRRWIGSTQGAVLSEPSPRSSPRLSASSAAVILACVRSLLARWTREDMCAAEARLAHGLEFVAEPEDVIVGVLDDVFESRKVAHCTVLVPSA